MAKSKAELLDEAKKLGLELTEKNTVAEITVAIDGAETAGAGDEKLAKAGKRSAKHIAEVEEKMEKEARKEAGDTTPVDPDAVHNEKKGPRPVTRPLIERRGKAYKNVAKNVDFAKTYAMAEALKLATETSTTKFDSTVEIHVRLGVDPRQADQNIRATVSLPNGTGKTVRVAAFVADADVDAAKKAGADVAGEEAITKLLDKESIDFDVLVATQQ